MIVKLAANRDADGKINYVPGRMKAGRAIGAFMGASAGLAAHPYPTTGKMNLGMGLIGAIGGGMAGALVGGSAGLLRNKIRDNE